MKNGKKFLMNLTMASAAVFFMNSGSALAATSTAAMPTLPENVCRSPDGNTIPDCPQGNIRDDSPDFGRWGRDPIIRRGYCFYHPRAPRCRF